MVYRNYHATKQSFINHIKVNESFAKEWGDLGPIYGKQWRSWSNLKYEKTIAGSTVIGAAYVNKPIDQIANLISELKTNPDSRRLMVNAWNVGELDTMVLPPCHYGFQVYTRELSEKEHEELWSKNYEALDKDGLDQLSAMVATDNMTPRRAISLMWNQRSVDTFLGLPFNIASYGLLLEIIAREVNMIPDELIGNLGDVHLYSNHIEQAKEQIGREPFELPTVTITERNWYLHEKVKEHLGDKTFIEKIESYRPEDFTLNSYQSHKSIKAPLSN